MSNKPTQNYMQGQKYIIEEPSNKRPIRSFYEAGQMLDLSHIPVIRKGTRQNLRILNEFPLSVLKTIREGVATANGMVPNRSSLYLISPLGCHIWVERELKEFLIQCRRRRSHRQIILPFSHFHGFTMTSEGLGVLAERITDSHGSLAPTLHDLAEAKCIGEKHIKAFHCFAERCIAEHVVISDITLSNIAWTDSRTGKSECVCIDGFGESVLIPVHTWSKRLNRSRIIRKAKKITKSLERSLGKD